MLLVHILVYNIRMREACDPRGVDRSPEHFPRYQDITLGEWRERDISEQALWIASTYSPLRRRFCSSPLSEERLSAVQIENAIYDTWHHFDQAVRRTKRSNNFPLRFGMRSIARQARVSSTIGTAQANVFADAQHIADTLSSQTNPLQTLRPNAIGILYSRLLAPDTERLLYISNTAPGNRSKIAKDEGKTKQQINTEAFILRRKLTTPTFSSNEYTLQRQIQLATFDPIDEQAMRAVLPADEYEKLIYLLFIGPGGKKAEALRQGVSRPAISAQFRRLKRKASVVLL